MIMVERGLLEETTTFMAHGSCGFKPLNWGESGNARNKPEQPNKHSVRWSQVAGRWQWLIMRVARPVPLWVPSLVGILRL